MRFSSSITTKAPANVMQQHPAHLFSMPFSLGFDDSLENQKDPALDRGVQTTERCVSVGKIRMLGFKWDPPAAAARCAPASPSPPPPPALTCIANLKIIPRAPGALLNCTTQILVCELITEGSTKSNPLLLLYIRGGTKP